MDLGLGNLADVKGFVLPKSIVDTMYDSVLSIIAKGIAGRFETYCNRKFGRVADDEVIFSANRSTYVVPRYPLENVSAMELRPTINDNWQDVLDTLIQIEEKSGLLYFGGAIGGDSMVLLRCTYTGGYWYETLEPLDADGIATVGYPSAMPDGAAPVPDDLKDAWLKQCLHEFELKDRLLPEGLANEASKSKTNWRLDQMVLMPEVENAIAQYRRFI